MSSSGLLGTDGKEFLRLMVLGLRSNPFVPALLIRIDGDLLKDFSTPLTSVIELGGREVDLEGGCEAGEASEKDWMVTISSPSNTVISMPPFSRVTPSAESHTGSLLDRFDRELG